MVCITIILRRFTMLVDREMAVSIIEELRPIINFDINFIGNDGVIIASTDSNREGQLHAGAIKLASNNLDQLIIYKDHDYEGCKKGINLPLTIDNRRIAIIGITGDPKDAIKYGNIVKKMTELLIQSHIKHIQNATKNNSNMLLINDLIYGNFNIYTDDIETYIIQSRLRPEGPFSVAIFSLAYEPAAFPDTSGIIFKNNVNDFLLKYFDLRHILYTEQNNSYVAISNLTCNKFSKVMFELKNNLERSYDVSIICHIGSERNDYREISKSYNEALILSSHTPFDTPGIYQFNMANLDIVIDQIPASTKELIGSSIFKNCTESETDDFCSFIICYFEFNGSLTKIADHNYQHKNTIQYKISKLKKKTALDIRVFRDMFVLYIAAIYHFSKKSGL